MNGIETSSADQQEQFATHTKRVLIVDDHALMRDGMRLMIESQPDLEVCAAAADEGEAMQQFRRARPNLVVVDITLKMGNGIELIKQLRSLDPRVRIIVSSMHDERIYGERCLLAGAVGFVSKQAPGDTLLKAIRHVLDGEMYFSEQLTQRCLRRAAGRGGIQTTPIDALTDRELEAFEMFGRGLAKGDIASRMCISPKTVDRYRENIKRKLDLTTSAQLIHHATLWVEQSRDVRD